MSLFKDFDFSILSDSDFKEDSVREELITPLLKALGYSVFGENKIIRSKSMTVFVTIGSQKQKINITPDYLLKIGNGISWILDAKHPKENILDGKHREQAFSYAILPDVRAYYYALCNGKEIVVFHIAKTEPVINVRLADIDNELNPIVSTLSPKFIKKHYFLQQGDSAALHFMDKMDELETLAKQIEMTGKLTLRKRMTIIEVIDEALDMVQEDRPEFVLSCDGKAECRKVIDYALELLKFRNL